MYLQVVCRGIFVNILVCAVEDKKLRSTAIEVSKHVCFHFLQEKL